MKTKQRMAELVLENNRIYIEWFQSQGYPVSKTDITPIWHFIKDNFGALEQYMKQPYEE